LGKGLIVTQIAVSVLLLIVGGLFGRTMMNIFALDSGSTGTKWCCFRPMPDG
jgi:hypothetical protein